MENKKLYDCPECRGNGDVLHAVGYPNGYREVWEACEFCEGAGAFDEDEFLLLKLEGKV